MSLYFRKLSYVPAFAALLSVALSCSDGKGNAEAEEDSVVSVDVTDHNSPKEGDAFTVTVTSNCYWMVSVKTTGSGDDVSWIAPSVSKGHGDGTVELVTYENTVPKQRSALVVIESTSQESVCNILVTQDAAEEKDYVSVDSVSFEAEKGGGTFTAKVTSNRDWTAVSSADWLTVSPSASSGDGSLSLAVAANEGDVRQATVTVATAGGGASASIAVTQASGLSVPTVSCALLFTASTSVGATWSVTGFTDSASDRAEPYRFGVYKDEACTDLLYRFSSKASSSVWIWANAAKNAPAEFGGLSPRFVFSGLTPNTDYWIKVEALTQGYSGVVKCTTLAEDAIDMTALAAGSASAGSVILNENFDEWFWGAEPVYKCVGYKSPSAGGASAMSYPYGDNAVEGGESEGLLISSSAMTGYFFSSKGLGNIVENSRMKGWREWFETETTGKMYQNIAMASGLLKVGGSKLTGDIVTPPLSPLSGSATVEVSFDACPYWEAAAIDPLQSRVDVFDASSASDTEAHLIPVDATPKQTVKFSLEEAYGWKRYTFTLSGVLPTDMIGIGGDKDYKSSSGQHRLYIDNVTIKVTSYD